MFVRRHCNCTALSISTMFSQLAYRLCKPAALVAGAALIPSVSRFSALISGSVADFLSECSMHYQQIMSLIANFQQTLVGESECDTGDKKVLKEILVVGPYDNK